jgi:hypothetical protein
MSRVEFELVSNNRPWFVWFVGVGLFPLWEECPSLPNREILLNTWRSEKFGMTRLTSPRSVFRTVGTEGRQTLEVVRLSILQGGAGGDISSEISFTCFPSGAQN